MTQLCEERRAAKREFATSSDDAESGQRRHRQLLGRLLWLKRSDIDSLRRADAESKNDITMRCGMVDDCYAQYFGVACWHPRGGAEYRLSPSHKIRLGTNCETSSVPTRKLTVTRHENRSCKYMEEMYCDSDSNNVILFAVINTLYTCLAGVKTKMTVGMSLCTTQKREMFTVGTSTRLSCEEAPRCMSMIWFRYNTLKSGD